MEDFLEEAVWQAEELLATQGLREHREHGRRGGHWSLQPTVRVSEGEARPDDVGRLIGQEDPGRL